MRRVIAVSFLGFLASLFGVGCGYSARRAKAEEFQSFLEECKQDLQRKMEGLVNDYEIDKYTHFDFNETEGRMSFSDEAGNALDCKIQIVGTFSNESNTWLWAWANPSILEDAARDSRVVRDYGTQHGFEKLTDPKWDAEESEGWAMTAVTAKLVSAKGAYRLPNKQVFVFMVFKNLQRRAPSKGGP